MAVELVDISIRLDSEGVFLDTLSANKSRRPFVSRSRVYLIQCYHIGLPYVFSLSLLSKELLDIREVFSARSLWW
jgi:hypothetical protein